MTSFPLSLAHPSVRLRMVTALAILVACGGESTGPASGDGPQEPPNLPQTVFPADNPWNQDISGEPVDPNSANLIAACGAARSVPPDFGTVWNGAPNGIP